MTSPVSIPAGHTLLASDFDAYENLTGVWTDYSSTFSWTATTNPAIGNGTITADYMRAGKFVAVRIVITMGSTTTFGTGSWILSLPVATNGPHNAVACVSNDSSAALRWDGAAWVGADSNTTMRPILGGGVNGVNATTPFAWASGDRLIVTGVYQVA